MNGSTRSRHPLDRNPIESEGQGEAVDAGVLFRRHGAFVAGFLGRIGAPSHELADLVQEVFVIVHRKGYVQGAVRPTIWLAEIARRVFANRKRWYRRRPSRDDGTEIDDLAAPHLAPDEVLEARRGVDRVHAALMKLSVDRRVVFVLYEIEGETCQAIATGLRIPIGTVYSRLHKARQEFQKSYERLRTRTYMTDPPPLIQSSDADPRLQRDLRAVIACPPAFDVGHAVARFEATAAAEGTGLATAAAKVTLASLLVAAPLGVFLMGEGPTEQAPSAEPAPIHAGDLDRGDSPTTQADERPADPSGAEGRGAPALASDAGAVKVAAAEAPKPVRRQARPTTPQTHPMPAPSPERVEGSSLQAEMAATQRARGLLKAAPARALAHARAAEQEFPGGVFSEERRAIIVLAVAALGRSAESTELAREFLAQFPESPHAPKIREIVGGNLP